MTLGKVPAVQTEFVLHFCSGIYDGKRRREGRRGGKNRLKIVSIWQHMIEFPGL